MLKPILNAVKLLGHRANTEAIAEYLQTEPAKTQPVLETVSQEGLLYFARGQWCLSELGERIHALLFATECLVPYAAPASLRVEQDFELEKLNMYIDKTVNGLVAFCNASKVPGKEQAACDIEKLGNMLKQSAKASMIQQNSTAYLLKFSWGLQ